MKPIQIRKAMENNLKGFDIDIPKNKLVVFTGVILLSLLNMMYMPFLLVTGLLILEPAAVGLVEISYLKEPRKN